MVGVVFGRLVGWLVELSIACLLAGFWGWGGCIATGVQKG